VRSGAGSGKDKKDGLVAVLRSSSHDETVTVIVADA